MKRTLLAYIKLVVFTFLFSVLMIESFAGQQYRLKDILSTSKGDLEIEVIGHSFLYFRFNRMNIYVDPVPNVADISDLPKADLILITHDHRDHLSTNTIKFLSKNDTKIIASKSCMKKLDFGLFLENGMQTIFNDIYIKAVAAYNVVNLRPDDIPYHPKGEGNGYFIVFGDKTIYVAGDTEYIDEMRFFMKPDVAFIPMMLPFTMSEDMFVQTVKKLRPKIVYPVHYNTNLNPLIDKLRTSIPDLEIRIR